jgi:predicted dehydrogenase
MNHNVTSQSRRDFIKSSAAVTTAFAAMSVPRAAHAGGSDVLKVGLIGCGNRGSGAVLDAIAADANTQLYAVGDTFKDKAESALATIQRKAESPSRITVNPDRIFSGFDAYKQVIDSGVDVVILAEPPHFRPKHLKYAVEKGKHTFVEKPIAVDVPGVHAVMKSCEAAKQKGLAIVSGLCWRYAPHVKETVSRIQEGAIGDIVAIESSYNTGTEWHRGDDPKWSRMEYQIRNWLYYTWLSGDHIVEQAIHSLDKTTWLQGDVSPVRAMGMGGRQQRTGPRFGNIFDHHAVFFEYASGIRVYFTCRRQDDCSRFVDDTVLGTKGTARIIAGRIEGEKPWRFRGRKPSMYVEEHKAMFKSIRAGEPINNGHYMCNSSLIAIMGRLCTYTGRTLTWDEANGSTEQLGPKDYAWGDVPEPPVPVPGVTKFA